MSGEDPTSELMITFEAELAEKLDELSCALSSIRRDASRAEPVASVMRLAHGLKGAARAVELLSLELACYELEGFVAARVGSELETTDVELLATMVEALRASARSHFSSGTSASARLNELTLRLRAGRAPTFAPAASEPAAGAERRSRRGSSAAPSDVDRQRRVLVADDSPTVRAVVSKTLQAEGWEVVLAPNGRRAWQLLNERGADAVICDGEMPELDGFALTELIRSSQTFARLPVILVTAHESEEDRRRGLALGADVYLFKSRLDLAELASTVSEIANGGTAR